MERRDRMKGSHGIRKDKMKSRSGGPIESVYEIELVALQGLLVVNGRWMEDGGDMYKSDGTCKIKLDRILVNEEWLEWRPGLILKSLGRSFSDHCPFILKNSIVDWGPKPFKFFNGWISHSDL
ncbi:hypothetical protein ACS0TY_012092 [Phlomoides rotata]